MCLRFTVGCVTENGESKQGGEMSPSATTRKMTKNGPVVNKRKVDRGVSDSCLRFFDRARPCWVKLRRKLPFWMLRSED